MRQSLISFFSRKIRILNCVCHGGNSDDLVSIPAMAGTVAVNFCVYFNGLYIQKLLFHSICWCRFFPFPKTLHTLNNVIFSYNIYSLKIAAFSLKEDTFEGKAFAFFALWPKFAI